MMDTLNLVALWAVHLALCLGVVAGAVCRVDEMNSKRNKRSWFFMYLAFGIYALWVLFEALIAREWNLGYLLGVVAIALNLVATLPHWTNGSPASSCRPGCRP